MTQRTRSRFNGDIDHCWEDVLRCEGGNAPSPTLPRKRGRERLRRGGGKLALTRLLHDGQGLVETQHFRGVRVALGEFRRALPTKRPRVRGDCGFQDLHQIFSRFTRNALNSGVYAFASPTNGVSEFASQFAPFLGSASAETPTKPQWIGMPTWNTF